MVSYSCLSKKTIFFVKVKKILFFSFFFVVVLLAGLTSNEPVINNVVTDPHLIDDEKSESTNPVELSDEPTSGDEGNRLDCLRHRFCRCMIKNYAIMDANNSKFVFLFLLNLKKLTLLKLSLIPYRASNFAKRNLTTLISSKKHIRVTRRLAHYDS